MEFDSYTITLLERRSDAREVDKGDANRIQDGHLAHLADLNDVGKLLACGPLRDERFAGLSILNVPPAEAVALKGTGPGHRRRVYTVLAMPWMVPAGAVKFGPARFPRSIADATR